MPTRSIKPLIAFGALFGASLLGAWCWFRTCGPQLKSTPELRILLTVETNIPQYVFFRANVSPEIPKILLTTNILSGSFIPSSPNREPPGGLKQLGSSWRGEDVIDRVHVFFATWDGQSKSPLTPLEHTPDICWAGVGWKPVEMGQPKQVQVEMVFAKNATALSPVVLPFECRVFRSPAGATEMAAWCTLVGGQPLPESYVSNETARSNDPEMALLNANRLRRTLAAHFWRSVRGRIPSDETKQFVRFSTRLMPMEAPDIRFISEFAAQWLKVDLSTGSARTVWPAE